jgi:hypothetical protein
MWILTRESFVSVLRHADEPDQMLVRSRRKSDIIELWPDAHVVATPTADYEFRAAVPEAEVIAAMSRKIHDIDYTTDFKGGANSRKRHDAYMRVWSALKALAT